MASLSRPIGGGKPQQIMDDRTRKFDLEYLSKELRRGGLTSWEKKEIERTIHKIINTSAPIQSLREELTLAARGGDVDRIRKIQAHIHRIRQEETNGREIS